MATAPQQPPPAQQEQAKAPPATVALDNLQAMMNLVLISTGRFLREQQSGGASGRMQFAMKRAVPAAEDRFHDSLDELENELSQAQAVLRRDLVLMRADRIKREQAEAAERQRRAAESSAKKENTTKPEPPTATAEPAKAEPTAAEEPENPDAEPAALHREDDPPPPTDTSVVPPKDPLFDETTVAATAQDTGFDFDAEFGDIGGEASNDTNQDIDMEAAPDLNFLAGLEDFAKGGEDNSGADQPGPDLDLDFAMPDLLDNNTNTSPDQPSTTTTKPAETPAVQQSNETTEDTNMLEPATIDDLDDLFNMDYENPEATQFDDAFFGFGE